MLGAFDGMTKIYCYDYLEGANKSIGFFVHSDLDGLKECFINADRVFEFFEKSFDEGLSRVRVGFDKPNVVDEVVAG